MRCLFFLLGLAVAPFVAEAGMIAARNLPAGTVIAAGDLVPDEAVTAGIADPALAIGRQTRIAIYAGRAVPAGALRDPVLVTRNQTVRLVFDAGTLRIETTGRALAEGAAGEWVRAMNLSSRGMVMAQIAADGSLIVPSITTGDLE